MKIYGPILLIILLARIGFAQGTFVYDQQSSLESVPGESIVVLQSNQPLGQSFTPQLSAVGFIRIELYDLVIGNGQGGTLYINLRSNSITGPIMSSTTPVSVPDMATHGFIDFFFPVPVSVSPGTTYFFQPFLQSGDQYAIGGNIQGHDYAGGTAYFNGQPSTSDLWFREGLFVPTPEPAGSLLLLVGATILFGARSKRGSGS